MAEFKPITAAEFERKKRPAQTAFRAQSAEYDAGTGKLLVQLTNGISAAFPLQIIKGLEAATPEALKTIEVQGRGFGLHVPVLDADISVSRLFADLLGSTTMIRAERRGQASRKNGAKGGRPKAAAQDPA